jgi:hypothetical protein
MISHIVYGAVGVIAVLLLLFTGAIIGWKLHISYIQHNHRVIREELTEEKKQKFLADQEAFDAMINYSPEMAYGLAPDTISQLAKKE